MRQGYRHGGGRIACAALVVAAAVHGCSDYDGVEPDVAAVDAGGDVEPPPVVVPPDSPVETPPDADSDAASTFLWEVHGPAAGIGLPVGLAANGAGGAHFGTSFIGAPVGSVSPPVGAAVLTRDTMGGLSLTAEMGSRAVEDIAVDSAGDVYLTGEYATAAAFEVLLENGGAVVHPATPGDGRTIAYVAKLNGKTGKTIWTWPLAPVADAGVGSSVARSIATRGQEVAVAFSFEGRAAFPTTAPQLSTVTSAGLFDGLVTFLNPATGSVLWLRRIGGPGGQVLTSLELDAKGNVLLGGRTEGHVAIADQTTEFSIVNPAGPSSVAPMFLTLAGGGAHDFLAGRVMEVDAAGTGTIVLSIATDSAGDVIACGRYQSAGNLDGVPAVSRGLHDGFIARYAQGGTERKWMKTFGGTLEDECTAVAVAPGGDIYVAINFSSSNLAIDSVKLADPTTGGQIKGALVRLGADGTVLSVQEVASTGPSRISKLAVGREGDVSFGGFFTGPVDLGGGTIDSPANELQFFVVHRSP